MKAAPALAMGNVMIVKASEYNPFSTLLIGELANQAGFPPGTLNVLIGTVAAGSALSSHMKIRKISFTGSIGVGKQIQIAATKSNLKRVTLELGGKSPVIVFDDADFEKAIRGSLGYLAFNGQGCINGTRLYVHEKIAESFMQALKGAVEGLAATLGADPYDNSTMSSPMFHAAQKNRVLAYIETGKKEAELVTGGKTKGDKGCYIEPTVFYKPKKGAKIMDEEIFGPVLVVDTFSTEEEVVRLANDTEYGLGAYVFTESIDRMWRMTAAIEAGTVCCNNGNSMHVSTPFNGHKGEESKAPMRIGNTNGS
jgi:aldehyde dehydrogenase (NAD+)